LLIENRAPPSPYLFPSQVCGLGRTQRFSPLRMPSPLLCTSAFVNLIASPWVVSWCSVQYLFFIPSHSAGFRFDQRVGLPVHDFTPYSVSPLFVNGFFSPPLRASSHFCQPDGMSSPISSRPTTGDILRRLGRPPLIRFLMFFFVFFFPFAYLEFGFL